MNYSPKQENKYVNGIIIALIAVGLLIYMMPNVLPVRAIFCQVPAMICLVAAVFFLVRYKFTSFIYSVRPRSRMHDDVDAEAAVAGVSASVWNIKPKYLDFVVSKKQGSREPNMECVLGLDSLIAVWDISKGSSESGVFKTCGDAVAKARETYGTVNLYDYTVTLGLEQSILLLFRDGEICSAIRIEPDESLRLSLINVVGSNKSE